MSRGENSIGRRVIHSPPFDLTGYSFVLSPQYTIHGNVIGAELTLRAGGDQVLTYHFSSDDLQHWLSRVTCPDRQMLDRQFDAIRVAQMHADTRCRVMGILNATPDSFSDGGTDASTKDAIHRGVLMAAAGADIVDVGGESTRPGAKEVPIDVELQRVLPIVRGLVSEGVTVSVDTRKAPVMAAAIDAGAAIINDVSALGFDPDSLSVVARSDVDVVLMHSQGLPENMQDNPQYDHVVFDVLAYLEDRITQCEQAGIDRDRLIVDPGIGFGKTTEQNLQLLRCGAMLKSTGCRVLMGASRKSLIGAVTGEAVAERRLAGSLAIANWSQMLGLDIVRVHDVAETIQAENMFRACRLGTYG